MTQITFLSDDYEYLMIVLCSLAAKSSGGTHRFSPKLACSYTYLFCEFLHIDWGGVQPNFQIIFHFHCDNVKKFYLCKLI